MLLGTDNIRVCYGETTVVDGVSLTIGENEIVSLIGPNGAGKSTILKGIMNIGGVKVSAGKITYKGEDITGLKTSSIIKMGLAYIPQGNSIFPSLTIEENLKVALHTINLKESEKTALDFVYNKYPVLAINRKRLAGTLSGGERQILGLARSLVGHPDLILLDEPSIGLSPKLAKELFGRIADLKTHGTSVILVEQRVKEAMTISDRTYLLKAGKVLIEGKSNDISNSEHIKKAYLGG